MPTVLEVYADTAPRLIGIGRSLSDAVAATPTPGCAGWTVHDVFAHLTGLTADVLAENLDGVATDPWTAVHVDDRRDHSLDQILDEWEANLPDFLGVLVFATRPPAALDVVIHEQDVRGALGLVGARDSMGVTFLAEQANVYVQRRLAEAGFPPVSLGRHDPGGDPAVAVDLTDFELGRGIMGRRSRRQIEAWPWSVEPTPDLLDNLTLFTPSTLDVVE